MSITMCVASMGIIKAIAKPLKLKKLKKVTNIFQK
jgi:hypothetical protein